MEAETKVMRCQIILIYQRNEEVKGTKYNIKRLRSFKK